MSRTVVSGRASEGLKAAIWRLLIGGTALVVLACAGGPAMAGPRNPVAVGVATQRAAAVSGFIDAQVKENLPTRNFGTAPALATQGGTSEDNLTYVRFTVSGIPAGGRVTKSTLSLFCFNGTVNGPGLRRVATNFTETGITWKVRPSQVSIADLDNKAAVSAGSRITFDLLPVVAGNGTYAFKLEQRSTDSLACYSREHLVASQRPVVTVEHVAYTFPKTFDVADPGNQQGLAYGGNHLWACFDTGGGNGKIHQYTMSGTLVKSSGSLPLGHCAELGYREADGTLWVAAQASGATVAHVRIVDMRLAKPAVVKSWDVTGYGLGQEVAIDNGRDQLVLKSGPGPYKFNFFSIAGVKGGTAITWLRQVSWPTVISTPQGMEIVGNDLLLMTSHRSSSGAWDHNRVNIFDLNGDLRTHINVPISKESEGLAVNVATKVLYLGFARANSVHSMSPAYTAQP